MAVIRNSGVAGILKQINVNVYCKLSGTSKSGRYIGVAAIPGWPLSGVPLYICIIIDTGWQNRTSI